MLFDGTEVNLLIAFIGGTVTFFASCFIPLVPTYLAYLSGIATDEKAKKKEVLINSIIFALGFITVFIIMGYTASSLGLFLRQNRLLVQKAGGVFMMVLGLFMLGAFKMPALYSEKRLNVNLDKIKNHKLKSFLFGITFGFAWTPCIGPVLGVILFWASQAATAFKGMALLLAYGLGMGVPFVFIGFFFDKFGDKIVKNQKFGERLNKIAAIVIILTGALLFIGKLELISVYFTRALNLTTHGV